MYPFKSFTDISMRKRQQVPEYPYIITPFLKTSPSALVSGLVDFQIL